MKLCIVALCSLFIVSIAGAAAAPTAVQVEAWKKQFPAISPGPEPKLYEMISEKKKTPANAEWFETNEKIQWLQTRLLPFLERMGG